MLSPSQTFNDLNQIRDFDERLSEDNDSIFEFNEVKESFRNLLVLIHELDEVFEECSHENWDGYGAGPISRKAYEEAKDFLNFIPRELPLPEVSPQPEGGIGFVWYGKGKRAFTASLTGEKTVFLAHYIDDNSRGSRREKFVDSVPKRVWDYLKSVIIAD